MKEQFLKILKSLTESFDKNDKDVVIVSSGLSTERASQCEISGLNEAIVEFNSNSKLAKVELDELGEPKEPYYLLKISKNRLNQPQDNIEEVSNSCEEKPKEEVALGDSIDTIIKLQSQLKMKDNELCCKCEIIAELESMILSLYARYDEGGLQKGVLDVGERLSPIFQRYNSSKNQ